MEIRAALTNAACDPQRLQPPEEVPDTSFGVLEVLAGATNALSLFAGAGGPLAIGSVIANLGLGVLNGFSSASDKQETAWEFNNLNK